MIFETGGTNPLGNELRMKSMLPEINVSVRELRIDVPAAGTIVNSCMHQEGASSSATIVLTLIQDWPWVSVNVLSTNTKPVVLHDVMLFTRLQIQKGLRSHVDVGCAGTVGRRPLMNNLFIVWRVTKPPFIINPSDGVGVEVFVSLNLNVTLHVPEALVLMRPRLSRRPMEVRNPQVKSRVYRGWWIPHSGTTDNAIVMGHKHGHRTWVLLDLVV